MAGRPEGLESSVPDGSPFIATRIFSPDVFFMTTGTGVPFDRALLEDVLDDVPLLRRKRPPEVLEDWRFAEAVYRLSARTPTRSGRRCQRYMSISGRRGGQGRTAHMPSYLYLKIKI